MENHKTNCRPGRIPFSILLGKVRFLGFGSYINNAANVFMIVEDVQNRHNYQPQFTMYDWEYGSLNTFFDDFAQGTECPLFKDLTTLDYWKYRKIDHSISYLSTGTNSTALYSDEPVAIKINSPSFLILRAAQARDFYHRDVDDIFSRKSALMKALWQPEPTLKKFIRLLWRNIMDENGRFTSVHFRRGDKFWGEATEVPMRSFADKILETCRVNGSSCPRNIYVMSDEDSAFEMFQSYFNESYAVYDLRTLMICSGMKWGDFFVDGDVTCRKRSARVADESFWLPHTRQLIVEITLLSLSDQLVCTLSSNICRLAALVRGSYKHNLHSMDTPTWHPWWHQEDTKFLNLLEAVSCGDTLTTRTDELLHPGSGPTGAIRTAAWCKQKLRG